MYPLGEAKHIQRTDSFDKLLKGDEMPVAEPYLIIAKTGTSIKSTSLIRHPDTNDNIYENTCACMYRFTRVRSGIFGHQVNSDIHFQTVEILMRRLLMSRLIRMFTVCLVNLVFLFQ